MGKPKLPCDLGLHHIEHRVFLHRPSALVHFIHICVVSGWHYFVRSKNNMRTEKFDALLPLYSNQLWNCRNAGFFNNRDLANTKLISRDFSIGKVEICVKWRGFRIWNFFAIGMWYYGMHRETERNSNILIIKVKLGKFPSLFYHLLTKMCLVWHMWWEIRRI